MSTKLPGDDPAITKPAQGWFRNHPDVVARTEQLHQILTYEMELAERNGEPRNLESWATRAFQINAALTEAQGPLPNVQDWPGWPK